MAINDVLARSYRRLFRDHTLADLKTGPEFVFDATSLQSGDLWRFSTRAEGDWRVGTRAHPDTKLAHVVAASSAFPPILSPARLSFPGGALAPGSDPEVNTAPYTTRIILSDGGVYDNLGLEAVWTRYKQVLISDAGGHMGNAAKPPAFWPIQLFRVLAVIDNQVRDLRKRQAVQSFGAISCATPRYARTSTRPNPAARFPTQTSASKVGAGRGFMARRQRRAPERGGAPGLMPRGLASSSSTRVELVVGPEGRHRLARSLPVGRWWLRA